MAFLRSISTNNASPTHPRRPRAAPRAGARRLSRNGRSCARTAARSSRRGSRSGRPTTSPSSPSAGASGATSARSATAPAIRSSSSRPTARRCSAGSRSPRSSAASPSRPCSATGWARPIAGKGLMTAAVRAVVGFAFDTLHLNRVEAACLPHNAASIRLLEKVGFRPRRLRPQVSVHRRALAGPHSLWPGPRRPAAVDASAV